MGVVQEGSSCGVHFLQAKPIQRDWGETLVRSVILGHKPYGYGSIPINTIFNGMNIHLPGVHPRMCMAVTLKKRGQQQ